MSNVNEDNQETLIDETVIEDTNDTKESNQFKGETEEQRAERLAKQQKIDQRSIFVGNVDFKTTPEQLETFFNVVGVIERITILFDRFTGLPKGYAYIEFDTIESAEKAINDLNGKDFRGRELKVIAKRTNLPRMSKNYRGRGSFRGRGRGDFNGRGRGEGAPRSRGSFRGRGRGSFKRGRGQSNESSGITETTTSSE